MNTRLLHAYTVNSLQCLERLSPFCLYAVLLPTFFQWDLSVCLTPQQQGQWHCPVIVLTACVPVGWRRVMRVFHYGRDGWVRLADADRQQMCKVGGWFVKGSTASPRRWRAKPGGGKLRRGRLSVIVRRCHRKVKVSSNAVSERAAITSANFFMPAPELCQTSLTLSCFSPPVLCKKYLPMTV